MEDAVKKIIEAVLQDQEIVDFIETNHITEATIYQNLPFLFQQKQNNDRCNACLGKKPCTMDVFEMQSSLEYHHGNINLHYHRCRYLEGNHRMHLQILFLPDLVPSGKLFKDKAERKQINNRMSRFLSHPKTEKGVYLYGSFGTGKTYILMKMAEALAKMEHQVVFAYYPDLVRHIKSSIGNEGYEALVNQLKTAEILILDDVGGEMNSGFIRDEILGPILQFRMMGQFPTFMTSNYSFEQLRNHFKETKYEEDDLRSDRIIERIRSLMDPIYLEGDNYR